MPPSVRSSLFREAANLCCRLVSVPRISKPPLTYNFLGKQYRPGPPGIDSSRRLDLLSLEEFQEDGSLGESEGATTAETAAHAEESLQDGLRLCLDYMEAVSQSISHRLETVKQASEFVRDGHDLEQWKGSLFQEEEALKRALQEKIATRSAIIVHVHFLRFCAWLKNQEETGSVEERLFWERSFLEVHTLVKIEVEGALRAVVDVEEGHPYAFSQ